MNETNKTKRNIYFVLFFHSFLWRYPVQTITDVDYADDIALLANTSTQAETPLHSLERAAAGIDLHVNVHKT